MADATLDDVIHRLKLNNRNTNRALKKNALEQAEAFGSVMGVTTTALSASFDASISRLISTSAMTVNDNVSTIFEEGNDQVKETLSNGDMFESPAYNVTLDEFDRMNETLYELRDISANGFDKLFNALAGDSLDEAERRRRQALAGREGSTVSAGAPEQRAGGGGLLSRLAGGLGLGAGLGFGLGGIGIGLGAAGVGVGVGAAGIAGLLFAVNELDGAAVRENVGQILAIKNDVDGIGDVAVVGTTLFALGTGLAIFGAGSAIAGLSDALTNFTNANFAQSIRDNVLTLLSISDEAGGNLALLAKGGPIALALGGLGVGIGLFGLGSVAAGAGDAIGNFTSENWAQNIKDNVLTLLSISDEAGGNLNMLVDGGSVALALSGLAAGLAIFGAGSAVAGLADGLVNFTSESWAQNIKDNVLTLLSIPNEAGGNLSMLAKGGSVALALSGLGAGLTAFAFGEGVSQAAQAVDIFRETSFADRIKDNVMTLLSISEIPLSDVGQFATNMGLLSAGLVAFAIGEGGNQITQAIDMFRETSFADRIVDNVSKLLTVVDLADEGKALKFLGAMTAISGGLAFFSAANAFEGLVDAGKRLFNFFGGQEESSFSAITKMVDNVDDLDKVANSLDSISSALNAFSDIKFDVRDADFKGLIKNIKQAVPLIESLSTGESKLFGRDIPSLLDPSLRLDELVVAMDQLNAISSGASQLSDINVRTVSMRAEQIATPQSQLNDLAASPTVVVSAPSTQNNSTVNQSNTVMNEVSMSPHATMLADQYVR